LQPLEEYTRRRARWDGERQRRQLIQNRLGNARLAVGILIAVIAAISFGPGWLSPSWLLASAVVLVALIAVHPRMDRALQRAIRLTAYYDRGLSRLQDQWVGKGSRGENLRDAQNIYAEDLDLFGRGSLFEFLSTARTATGERTLAGWLLAPGEISTVRARQDAVQELSSRLDLREDLAALGEDIRAALDDRQLSVWGARPPVHFFHGARWIALLLAIVATAAGIAWLAAYASLRPFFYVAVVEVLFAMSIRKAIEEVTASVNTPAQELQLIALLLERIEHESFSSSSLAALRERLRPQSTASATQQIRRLQRLVEWKEWAHNQIFGVIAAPLLWVPQFAMAIEKWRQQHGPDIAGWVAAVGEFEAFASLASFAYEHPLAAFPELLGENDPRYEAESLVHPLIPEAEAVPNDVALGGETRLWIISGSNMSGKSTLLRAVGISIVMAWAGAPVTARALRLTRLQTGASLRANDSLADHRSRFYAEIVRLKQVVDAANGPLFFLLDELLSGTNSHDRRIGAEALIGNLLNHGAIGLATTHDLALAEIALELGARARNVHFEDRFESGKITWDYKLRPGVVRRGNALDLMRAVGLDV
jgi:hypothetical protein